MLKSVGLIELSKSTGPTILNVKGAYEQEKGFAQLSQTLFVDSSLRMFAFDFGRADSGRDIASEIQSTLGENSVYVMTAGKSNGFYQGLHAPTKLFIIDEYTPEKVPFRWQRQIYNRVAVSS